MTYINNVARNVHLSYSEEKIDTTMLFSYYDDLFRSFDKVMQDWFKPLNERDEKKENEKKEFGSSKETKHCADDAVHSWCRQKELKKVNGDVTYRSDKEWKDGKLVKEDVYDPKKALSETTEGGKCDHKRCCGKKKDGSVRIDAERYEQLVDTEKNYKERLHDLEVQLNKEHSKYEAVKSKLEGLQHTLKSICND